MESYEKKYKNALEWARQVMSGKIGFIRKDVEEVFPELKESDDEKIRKEIISALKFANHKGVYDKHIAWLEKQGETFTKSDVAAAYFKGISNAKKEMEKQYEANYQIRKDIATFIFNYRGDIKDRAKWMDYLGITLSLVEKQGEKPQCKSALETIQEKEVDNSNKVEPKFKVKYAGNEYNVIEEKDIDGVTFYGIEDEPNHIDYVKADSCEIINAEPKFKVGDWITLYGGKPFKIVKIEPERYGVLDYLLLDQNGHDSYYNKKYIDKNARLCTQEDFASKVEPKFHEGDWIVGANNICKIISLNDDLNCYIALTINNEEIKIPYYFDDEQGHMCSYHLWSINDAKDGDVLVTAHDKPFIYNGIHNRFYIGSYCGISAGYRFNVASGWVVNVNIHPATKEQRDTLMKAMADAGYTFGFEKKELKKIKHNPAWSEENECYMTECINAIATKNSWSFEEKRKTKHWLKSLKERII